jgi:5-methylcytosine-specific restriction endonuclease McrA
MHKQTKATAIPKAVKEAVYRRDGGRCVLCGRTYQAEPNAHVIARSQGGMGIEKNVVTLCWRCHDQYDNSADRHEIRSKLERYLLNIYPDWKAEDMIFHKYKN